MKETQHKGPPHI